MKAFKLRRLFVLSIALILIPGLMKAQSLSKAELDDISSKMISNAVATVSAHSHNLTMQSPSCTGYSFGQPGYQFLAPSDEAAQGRVTGTITEQVTNVKGALLSHNVTVTPGTIINLVGSSNNGSTAKLCNSGTCSSVSLNGNLGQWTATNAWIGYTNSWILEITAANGSITQDHVAVSVVDGSSPKIINQDAIPKNSYVRFNPNFGGGAMAQTCQICIQQPSACAGAQHTPYLTASITNNTSGETVLLPRQVAGSIVDENSPISGSLFLPQDISVVPGDDLSGSATGEIFCSAEQDNIWNQFLSWRVEYGKTVVKDLGHPPRYNAADKSYLYDVAPICDNNSDPADWQPSVVHSWSGRHTYWFGVTSLLRWPDVSATKWIPAADIMVDWTTSGPFGGVIDLLKMAVEGGAIPYPGGSGPDFPVPGACTRFVGFDSHTGKPYYNVILTLGSGDLPWWPQLN